ncbi:MAG: glycosyltransferase [Filomicrobium sp.]
MRSTGSRRIAIASATGSQLVRQDLPFIQALINKGHKVLCFTPEISEIEWHTLLANGAAVEQLDLVADRWALMPNRQVATRVMKSLSEWSADTVIARGGELLAAVVDGARRAKVPRIIPVVDWSVAPADADQNDADARDEVDDDAPDYLGRAFDLPTVHLCYNHDHAARLEYSGLLCEGASTVVLPNTGVDLETFPCKPLPRMGGTLTFLMISDMRQSNGVLDFCKAARLVLEESPNTEFILAGAVSEAEDAVALRTLAEFRGVVEYAGDAKEPAELIERCHVFVYPVHGIGLAFDALPALAMGRPLVVSDAPGCRDLVDERVNGCFAEAGNELSLADAMASYLKRPELIPSMARASRHKAERRFDRRLSMAALFELIGLEQTA